MKYCMSVCYCTSCKTHPIKYFETDELDSQVPFLVFLEDAAMLINAIHILNWSAGSVEHLP